MKELKKTLEGYEKKELIGLVLELARLRKDNMILYVEKGTEITLKYGDIYYDELGEE